jgi:signal transduction histidine kinase
LIRRLPWPRSLPSQMAVLIALALFAAQMINLALIYQGRNQLRQQTVVGPAVTRYVDTVERLARGAMPDPDAPGRLELRIDNPVQPNGLHNTEIQTAIATGLREAGMGNVRVETEIRRIDPRDPRLAHYGRFRAERFVRFGAEMIIAMNMPGRGWLVMSAPWPRSDAGLLWQLVGQTLILYGVVLVPVLFATRQISRPLQQLAHAAQQFRPGQESTALVETGPPDVRAVIGAFNALRLRVTGMLEEKDRMLGAIGHDLRTPLAALRVRIESVEDEGDRAKMADTIAEMNRTLDDILSLARLGRPSEPMVNVDLAALVDAVVEDFRDLGNSVSFTETERLTMQLRPSLMRRALRNLIENAIKYGREADVRMEREAHQVAIIVADRGPGIPPDKIEAVFDPFTRLETSRNRDTGGIGLGLALARAIVGDAGGNIVLVNRPKGGLEARITLPLVG